MPPGKRTIIFGDIHACHEEWRDLMDALRVAPDDQLISVGDLVCKGPSTRKTLDLAMALPNLQCVLGNHELSLLKRWKTDSLQSLATDYQREAVEELGDRLDLYMRFLEQWPFYLDLPEALVIHAGLRPGVPLEKQTQDDLTRLRAVDPDGRPWYEFYTGAKLVVHGHWAAQGLVVRPNVIGLDTGCVYGNRLSAVVLPGREIVSVPARRAYSPIG